MGNELGVPSTFRSIPLGLIRENKTALRGVRRESQEYQELLASVRRDGVLMNITVRECQDPDTKEKFYGLVDGLQRLTAAKDAGLETLDCKVIQADDFEVLRKQIVLNIQRIETKPAEYSQQLARMMNANPLLTISELSEMLGKSPEFIYQRLSLLKLDNEISKVVDEGRITLANAYALAKLPQEEQRNFVERAVSMQPNEFIPLASARLKEIREANRKGQAAHPPEFVPIPRLRKLAEIKDEHVQRSIGPQLLKAANVTTLEEAFALGVKWVLHVDPLSIESDKAKEEARRKEAKDAAERRKTEREARKEREAEEISEKLA